jgi:hypothetical protein
MGEMKVINYAEQASQPMADSEDVLVEFDVKHLIECLGYVRNTSYSIVQRPDVIERNAPHPDYLVEDDQTGNSLAIEHARFFESQKNRKHVAVAVRQGGGYMGFVNFPSPEELGKRLSEFFDDKIGKGQFAEFGHCERILLARSRWGGISTEGFLKCEPHFKPLRQKDCDHFYLIVQGHLVEIF